MSGSIFSELKCLNAEGIDDERKIDVCHFIVGAVSYT